MRTSPAVSNPSVDGLSVTVERRHRLTVVRLAGAMGERDGARVVALVEDLVRAEDTTVVVVDTEGLRVIAPTAADALLAACARHARRVIPTEPVHLQRCRESRTVAE